MQGYAAGAEVVELRPVVFSVAADERQLPVGLLVEGAAAREVILVHGVGLLLNFQPEGFLDGVPHRRRFFEDKPDVDTTVLLQPFKHGGDGFVAAEEAPAVAEMRHAVEVERHAQVKAPRTGGKLLVYRFALAPGEGEHEPVPPPAGRQIAHGVVGADDCFKCRLFHIVFCCF